MKTTLYFNYTRKRPDRAQIKDEWIDAKPLLFHFDKRLSIPSKSRKDGNENDTKQRVLKLRKLWKL